MISNEMQNLSAHVNFPDAHYQLPLLIMSKIVAEIQFVYKNCKKYALYFFPIQTMVITSKLKQEWLLHMFVINICAY